MTNCSQLSDWLILSSKFQIAYFFSFFSDICVQIMGQFVMSIILLITFKIVQRNNTQYKTFKTRNSGWELEWNQRLFAPLIYHNIQDDLKLVTMYIFVLYTVYVSVYSKIRLMNATGIRASIFLLFKNFNTPFPIFNKMRLIVGAILLIYRPCLRVRCCR